MRAPDFWAAPHSGQGAAADLLARFLAPLGGAYALAGRLQRALVSPATADCPVICVGNLVAGGAGKTPVVLSLAGILCEAGHCVHLLTRGYGGRAAGPLRVDPRRHDAQAVGDEALLLAGVAPTWVSHDRPAGARAAAAAGAGIIVMDDGFQNPTLGKDLSLLVVDGSYGFGNGRVMPAGPLRETVERGLARADAVVLMEPDRQGLAARLAGSCPLLWARLVPGAGSRALRGRRVFAFAGIGQPQKFFDSLAETGAELTGTRAFPDHHRYRRAELEALFREAEALAAQPVTTQKDAVRMPPDLQDHCAILRVQVAWRDRPALMRLLQPFALAN